MSNKLFTIIFAIAFIVAPATSKGNNLKEHMNLLYTNMDDSEVLDSLKEFAQEIFQIESEQDNLYDFLVEFLSKDLEQVSEIGELDEAQQKEKIQLEIQNALQKHFDEKIANSDFELDKEGFQDAFEKVQDIYERQFLAILGRKIKLGDRDLRLPFDFVSQLFNQIKALNSNQAFVDHYQKQKVSTINSYIKFLNENQNNFQSQYKDYLKTYANYAILVTDNYSQFAYDLDNFFNECQQNMNEDNREDMVQRIRGLTQVFIKLNDSGEAVTVDFRDKEEQDSEEQDNRSEDEKRRDLKDYLILRLQTLRIEAMDEENGNEDHYLNLSYITNAVVSAFIEYDSNSHIFYHMRNIFIQNITISSANSVQSKILEQIYDNLEVNEQELLKQANQLGDDDVLPQVLILADILALPIFEQQEQQKNTHISLFKTLYQKILAIPAKILQGNGALQLLGHYAIAPEGQEQDYYVEFYQLICKFRLQNNFNLQLLEDHFQSAIAMQFFVNQQYVFEKEHESNSNLVSNYFKFKTTILLHMIAFVDKEDYTEEEELEQLKQMYQVQYEQATDEELNELLSGNYQVYRPSNVKTSLKKILEIFAEYWEYGEEASNAEFEFTKESLDMFSQYTFNLLEIVGNDMKDHITINITQSESVTRKLPIGLQANFKIGLYGVEALHYQEAEKNKNLTAQEKQNQQKQESVSSSEQSFQMSNEEKDLNRGSIKRTTNTHLEKVNSSPSSSQENVLNQSQKRSKSESSISSHDISDEENRADQKQNQKQFSFSQGSNQDSDQEQKLKRQNNIGRNFKQGEEFSFGQKQENSNNSDNSDEEDNVHKNIAEGNPFNKIEMDTSSISSHDISEEENLADKIKNQKQLSQGQGSNEDSDQEQKLKRQNNIGRNFKQGEEFSFGQKQENSDNSDNSDQEDSVHISGSEGIPFDTAEVDTRNQLANKKNDEEKTKLDFRPVNSNEEIVDQNVIDLQNKKKQQSQSSSEEVMHQNIEDPNKKNQLDMTSSEEDNLPLDEQEKMVNLNKIDINKAQQPSNKVTFISGQPLNQKEEEYLQDPNLINKLKQNKDENNQVTFENDDGSITEIVYVQIIPYGSDCYNSYQAALLDN